MTQIDEAKNKKRERDRRYYEVNREKIIEKSRRYRKLYPEKAAEAFRRWCEANPEKMREYHRQYRESHPDEIAEKKRQYRESNSEKIRKQNLRYRKEKLENRKANNRRRRMRMLGIDGNHTEAEWQALCSYYMDQCLCCGNVPDKLTRDHVVPILMGGTDDISNIQPLCLSCNCRKHANTIDYRF